jgi:hypothetical protein
MFLRGRAEFNRSGTQAYDIDQWQCPPPASVLRAVRPFLRHSKIESTGRYLGINDAIEIAAAHAPIGRGWLSSRNCLLVDIFLLRVVNPHEGLDGSNYPLGIADEIFVGVLRP